ncbi:DnaB-like helicase N-terminal domain-containing protein [Streptomyces silvisoli]|uniref:DnaB-like helicase N-terminal domain-containing protein n=1 Tax=Streptomyces silvisoli TaxID=3034235 RepID=A0ABT5ZQF9_9ACTN|nr:DnaB-like helicase N-terminal domain-containing protein [Streptomyces silvisoli]MDF3291891.1 DnaB-like helicase N-terminal domain-containing protein [Streptomyces silvisoli]
MTPLIQAEQAVLGAILLDPDQLPRLSAWLAPDHFYRPLHGALYAAMLHLHAAGHEAAKRQPGHDVPMSWVTDTLTKASTRIRGVTASYAHTLIAACPRPAHAPVYGRMVLEGAIHRSVAEHATRLHQAAHADAIRREVEGTVHHVQVLTEVLDDLARRWGTEPRATAQPQPQPPSTTASAPSRVPDGQLEDEPMLLASLVDHSTELGELVAWLRPEDFADPGHGHLYRCLGALHHRGEPIDPLTVLWEAQRRGVLIDGSLDADQILTICGTPGIASEHFGERVLRSSLLRTAAASARQVGELSDNRALAPGRLIGYALHALKPVDDVHRRWRIATGASDRPTSPQPRSSARMSAALARSQPHPAARGRPQAAATPASLPAARSHHRNHS